MTATTTLEALRTEYNVLTKAHNKEVKKLEREYEKIADVLINKMYIAQAQEIKAIISGEDTKTEKNKNIVKYIRKASTILANRTTHKAIVLGEQNMHWERHVNWYTGKKGAEINDCSRMGINSWSKWLGEQENA